VKLYLNCILFSTYTSINYGLQQYYYQLFRGLTHKLTKSQNAKSSIIKSNNNSSTNVLKIDFNHHPCVDALGEEKNWEKNRKRYFERI